MNTFTFECGKWAIWNVQKGYYLSDESIKKLLQFDTLDQIVNYLYIIGDKAAARALNKVIK